MFYVSLEFCVKQWLMLFKQWPAKGFVPHIYFYLKALSLQHTQMELAKNNAIAKYEILVQKANFRWHGSDKAFKLNVCG